MNLYIFSFLFLAVPLFIITVLCLLQLGEVKKICQEKIHISPPEVKINLESVQNDINSIPGRVLQSITSSTNTHKGAIGELIGYLDLRASYDRIIPLGSIVDFVCIKLPTIDEEGHIDFVDVKSGDHARLSKEQSELKKLIEAKAINFVKIKIKTENINLPYALKS